MLLSFDLTSHRCSPIIYEISQVNLHRCKLSRRVPGAHCDDLLNIIDNWIKNIVASGLFCLFFVAADKKQVAQNGFCEKNDMDVSACQRIKN